MAKAKKEPAPEVEDGEETAAPAKKKLSGKTLILFIVLPALLVLGGGGAAAYFLLLAPKSEQHADAGHGEEHAKDGKDGAHGEGEEAVEAGVYRQLPDMIINISDAEGRPALLKLKLTLEAADEATLLAADANMPRVLDQFQSFLRELRVDDLSGSVGSARLRAELLRRVNIAIAPAQVNAVLIEEMLVN